MMICSSDQGTFYSKIPRCVMALLFDRILRVISLPSNICVIYCSRNEIHVLYRSLNPIQQKALNVIDFKYYHPLLLVIMWTVHIA